MHPAVLDHEEKPGLKLDNDDVASALQTFFSSSVTSVLKSATLTSSRTSGHYSGPAQNNSNTFSIKYHT